MFIMRLAGQCRCARLTSNVRPHGLILGESNEMNSALEFHDSEVSSITDADGSLHVRFSAAYVHRSDGVPGVDSGEGYIQAVELTLENASWDGSLAECIGKLSDGELFVVDRPLGLVPLPFESTSQTRVELQFSNGATLLARGAPVHVRTNGAARFVERFVC